jgi:hypothetical protein
VTHYPLGRGGAWPSPPDIPPKATAAELEIAAHNIAAGSESPAEALEWAGMLGIPRSAFEDAQRALRAAQGRCEQCGQPGQYVIDPFIREVYERDVERWLCDGCYAERKDDI